MATVVAEVGVVLGLWLLAVAGQCCLGAVLGLWLLVVAGQCCPLFCA